MDIITIMKNSTKLILTAFSLVVAVVASSAIGASKEEAMQQYELGMKYLKGEDVKKNVGQGFELVKRASDQGLPEAQYLLANLYLNGLGVSKNRDKSFLLLNKASDQNNISAKLLLGRIYGSGAGGYDVAVDKKQSFQFYQQAALQGDIYAQNKVGFLFAYGKGVKKDKLMAAKWYERAAEQGDANAQYNVGMAYRYGTGVAENETAAKEWFELAAKQGNRMARKELRVLE